jgi:hypothetical protein
MKKIMMAFATFALAVASASPRYHVTLYDQTWVGGNELKPGDYTVEMQGDKAVFKYGKTVVEVPAKMEENDSKYNGTRVRMSPEKRVKEIDFGGTKSRIVLEAGVPTGD